MGRRSGSDHPGSGLFRPGAICDSTSRTNANRTLVSKVLKRKRPATRGRDAGRGMGEIQLGKLEIRRLSETTAARKPIFEARQRPAGSEQLQKRMRAQGDTGMNNWLQNSFSSPANRYHISRLFHVTIRRIPRFPKCHTFFTISRSSGHR